MNGATNWTNFTMEGSSEDRGASFVHEKGRPGDVATCRRGKITKDGEVKNQKRKAKDKRDEKKAEDTEQERKTAITRKLQFDQIYRQKNDYSNLCTLSRQSTFMITRLTISNRIKAMQIFKKTKNTNMPKPFRRFAKGASNDKKKIVNSSIKRRESDKQTMLLLLWY